VAVLVVVVVGVPGAEGGADDDGVDVGGHGVFYVGGDEEEAANGIGLEMLEVECFAEADFEGALDDGDSGVGGVPMMLVEAGGDEGGVGEGFAGGVAISLEHGPFCAVGIDFLPLDVCGVPGLR